MEYSESASRHNAFGTPNKDFCQQDYGKPTVRHCPECGAMTTYYKDESWHCMKCGWSQTKEELLRYGEEEIRKIKEGICSGKTAAEIADGFDDRFKRTGVIAKVTEVRKGMYPKERRIEATPKEGAKEKRQLSDLAKDIIALEEAGFQVMEIDLRREQEDSWYLYYIRRPK